MILKVRCDYPVVGTKHPYQCVPYLPLESCFFDSRHGVVGIGIIPFAITTRIDANNQQFLFEVIDD